MTFKVKNNASSTVVAGGLDTGTTLTLVTGGGAEFPTTGNFRLTIWDSDAYLDPGDDTGMEIVECTARTGDSLTIVRSREGTANVSHAGGEEVALLITAGIFDDTDTSAGIYDSFVKNSDLDVQSLLGAVSDDTPIAITFATDSIAGRRSGNIAALSPTDARAVLSVEENADVTDTANVTSSGALMKTGGTMTGDINTGADINPTINNAYDLGDTTHAWRTAFVNLIKPSSAANLYLRSRDDVVTLTINTAENGISVSGGPLRSASDGGVDLGTSSFKWNNVYANTLYGALNGQLAANLDLNQNNIGIERVPDGNTCNGITITMDNGNATSVAMGDVCYMDSTNSLKFADADSTGTMPAVAMACETITAGSSGEWLLFGTARRLTGWSWTDGPGIAGLIYVSTTGTTGNTLTQTKPAGAGDQVQIAGYGTASTLMMFNPSPVLVEIS